MHLESLKRDARYALRQSSAARRTAWQFLRIATRDACWQEITNYLL